MLRILEVNVVSSRRFSFTVHQEDQAGRQEGLGVSNGGEVRFAFHYRDNHHRLRQSLQCPGRFYYVSLAFRLLRLYRMYVC